MSRASLVGKWRYLRGKGATAHAIPADLSDTGGVPDLARQIRDRVGDLDALYYGPTSGGSGLGAAASLRPQDVQGFMPAALYTLVALVGEFLPHMIGQHDGAILLATGASAVHGMPRFSGPGPALAAQRNYLQSLQAEVAGQGVYVGRLYIGTVIAGSAWHARVEAGPAAGRPAAARGPAADPVDPADLADLLWTMHHTTRQPEALYPEGIFGPRGTQAGRG